MLENIHNTVYALHTPVHIKAPVLFNSPHSGHAYPPHFIDQSKLNFKTLRNSEDAFVNELLENIQQTGLPWLEAFTPRAFVDFNRARNEIDASMIIEKRLPVKLDHSHRVASGLGVIPKVVSSGLEIYPHKIAWSEIEHRLQNHYDIYHQALTQTLNQLKTYAEDVYLLDIHSMPSHISGHNRLADIIIGDKHGGSCAPWLTRYCADHFQKSGLRVALNSPFSGGFITSHYGKPHQKTHVLQIEIRRNLYMNEGTLEKNANFENIKSILFKLASSLTLNLSKSNPIAAE